MIPAFDRNSDDDMRVTKAPGETMRGEIAEAHGVFVRTVLREADAALMRALAEPSHAIFTVARGSSDAAATILGYEFMRVLERPVTSLPPSIFSLGPGVAIQGVLGLIVSQSGGSDDLVRTAAGMRRRGARVVALCNMPGAPLEQHADAVVPIGAGPENAIPATKSVVGSIAAGMSLLAAISPAYRQVCAASAREFGEGSCADSDAIVRAVMTSDSIYVVGRGAGYGAAQEIALKIKECCMVHAEAFSASEVLHGPVQLVERSLTMILLDTGEPATQPSLDLAETRFRDAGATVFRVGCPDASASPAATAAQLLCRLYPVVLEASLALGCDPDRPVRLAKVTKTR